MVVEDKRGLRRRLRAERDAITPGARAQWSSLIAQRVVASLAEELGLKVALADGRRVALFASVGSEVDTEPLLSALVALGIEVAFPRVVRAHQALEFSLATGLDDLSPGQFEVPEPEGPAIDLRSLDVVILPGLAFDRSGGRLGYGAGYYDRTLVGYSGPSVGLAFDCQIVPRVPVAPHDRAMDSIITQSETIEVSIGLAPVSSLERGPPCQT